MTDQVMTEVDIDRGIPLYIDYYNHHKDGVWTRETTYKRIQQVWSREDAFCLLAEENRQILGFAMGYMEQ